jgi:hypothetical protein
MKYKKILRILGIALVLSLLMAVIPAVAVLAYDYEISISPTQGKVGDTIHINGSSFTPSTDSSEKHARIIFAAEQVITGKYIDIDVNTYKIIGDAIIGYTDDTDEGEFSTTFIVPSSLLDGSIDANVAPGTYYVYVVLMSGSSTSTVIKSVDTFTVTPGASLDPLSPATGPAGTDVSISGSNFVVSSPILFKYDDTAIAPKTGDLTTRSSGIFNSTITIPSSTPGAHTITVTVGSSIVTVTFTVIAGATLDPLQPASGPVGANVTISGASFPASTAIIIKFDTTIIIPITGTDTQTRTSGVFISTITIPQSTVGAHTITVTAGSGTATANFTVTETPSTTPPPATPPPTTPPPTTPPPSATAISINQSGNTIGSLIGIGGSGFKHNSKVTVKYDDKEVATGNTDASGFFLITFQVPPGKHGDHTITASDGTNTNKATFTVESTPPKIPQPVKPEMGVKVKAPITYDWEDVTDNSSPVTYNLQVASASDFAPSSLILDKTAIAKSEYTLTEVEELKLAGQTSRLFWRIKAVDAALNESDWSGAGEFSVAQPFKFAGWPLYLTIGIGAVLVFLFGFWIGRRTAFYY